MELEKVLSFLKKDNPEVEKIVEDIWKMIQDKNQTYPGIQDDFLEYCNICNGTKNLKTINKALKEFWDKWENVL